MKKWYWKDLKRDLTRIAASQNLRIQQPDFFLFLNCIQKVWPQEMRENAQKLIKHQVNSSNRSMIFIFFCDRKTTPFVIREEIHQQKTEAIKRRWLKFALETEANLCRTMSRCASSSSSFSTSPNACVILLNSLLALFCSLRASRRKSASIFDCTTTCWQYWGEFFAGFNVYNRKAALLIQLESFQAWYKTNKGNKSLSPCSLRTECLKKTDFSSLTKTVKVKI